MKSLWKWILLGVAVFGIAFLVSLPLWIGGPVGPDLYSGYGMMGRGMMGGGSGWFGWVGMLFRLLIPLILIGGVIALVYYLAKRPSAPPPPAAAPATPCANCGKPLDPGWMACPYCGKKVK